MSLFESDNYSFSRSEAVQSVSEYSPFTDVQYNYINDLSGGIYAATSPALVQFDLSSIFSSSSMIDINDSYLAIPIVMNAQYVNAAGQGIQITAANQLAGSAGLLSLKNGYNSLVHQIEMSIGGVVVNSSIPYQNMIQGFKMASRMNGGTDLKQTALSLGISDVGVDNPFSVQYNSLGNHSVTSTNTVGSIGVGLCNNKPYNAATAANTAPVGTAQQGAVGNQNVNCVNDAIARKLSRYVDVSGSATSNIYGSNTSSSQTALGVITNQNIMTASQLNTEFKPYVTISNPGATAVGANIITYYDVALIPLRTIMDIADKYPIAKSMGSCLLRIYLNVGSLMVPVVSAGAAGAGKSVTNVAGSLIYNLPQSSNFTGTCPYNVNYLDSAMTGGVPVGTVGIATGVFIGKTLPTSLSQSVPPGSSLTATNASVNLAAANSAHALTTCRLYFKQVKLSLKKEIEYVENNRNKMVVYEQILYNASNTITSGSSFSSLINSGIKNPLYCLVIPLISPTNLVLSGSSLTPNVQIGMSQYSSPFDTCGGMSYAPISLTNFQVQLGGKNILQNSTYFTFENFLQQVCEFESVSGTEFSPLGQGIFNQLFWEQNRVYFANLSRSDEADNAMPRNISVSFQNNCNLVIDVMIFIGYRDKIIVDVASGLITKP